MRISQRRTTFLMCRTFPFLVIIYHFTLQCPVQENWSQCQEPIKTCRNLMCQYLQYFDYCHHYHFNQWQCVLGPILFKLPPLSFIIEITKQYYRFALTKNEVVWFMFERCNICSGKLQRLCYIRKAYNCTYSHQGYNIFVTFWTHGRPTPVQFKQNLFFQILPFVLYFIDDTKHCYISELAINEAARSALESIMSCSWEL